MEEIEYHIDRTKANLNIDESIQERDNLCNPKLMFENLLHLIENKDTAAQMPVRKFFNNTFGRILNDALYALEKK